MDIKINTKKGSSNGSMNELTKRKVLSREEKKRDLELDWRDFRA